MPVESYPAEARNMMAVEENRLENAWKMVCRELDDARAEMDKLNVAFENARGRYNRAALHHEALMRARGENENAPDEPGEYR